MNWKQTLIMTLAVLIAITAATTPAMGAVQTQQADIQIEQPRYISEPVNTQSDNGFRLYVARGKHLEIRPQNFKPSDVTEFSVQESEGVLTYDKQSREYILNTQGNSGTYHVRWRVSQNNSTATYTAKIRVVEANYAHLPASQYKQFKQQYRKYNQLIDSIKASGDPDTPVKQKVEFGNSVRDFKNNPFSALTGQFMALQILRFTTPAGWLDFGIIILLVYGLTRGLYSTIARLRKQLEKEEQIARREDEQYQNMMKQVLAGKPMTEVDAIDDHQAGVLEEKLGKNLYTALHNFWNTWGANSLKAMYADAMGTVGYSVRFTRDNTGNVQSVTVLDPDSDSQPVTDGGENPQHTDPGAVSDDGLETMNLSNAPDDVLESLTWDEIDKRVFRDNPEISAVDHVMVANREGKSDLIEELGISIPEDFQSRQMFMEAIGHFLQEVQETDFTDEHGKPRESRAVLNNIMAFTTVMEQEYDVGLDLWWRAAIWNAEGLSRDSEAESVLSDIQDSDQILDEVETGTGSGSSFVGGD